jgi:hypothetical protein
MTPRTLTLAVAVAAAATLALAGPAAAQSGNTRMMVVDDSEMGPMVVHFTGPDLRELAEPDYLLSDLPVFTERLRLDEPQTVSVRGMIDRYLEAFRVLSDEKLRAVDPMAYSMMNKDGNLEWNADDHGHGQHAMGDMGEAIAEAFDGVDVDFAAGEGQVMIAIEAGAGMGELAGGGGEGYTEDVDVTVDAGGAEGPVADVRIAVAGPDGAELPPEVREKLEAKLAELAEEMQEKLESGELDTGGMLTGPEDAATRMENAQIRFEEMAARAAEFEAEKASLAKAFVAEVQASLEGTQIDHWPTLDRALVRTKTLPNGRLDGERTDLLEVLDQVTADAAPAGKGAEELADMEFLYELALHDALVRRNEFLEDADEKVNEAMQVGDTDKALSIIDRGAQRRVAVRSVNQQFTESFASVLDDETAEAFRERVREVSYPRVYRRNVGLRAFEKARQLPDLPEETLLRILDLESPYRAELEVLNERLRRVIDEHQPDETRRPLEQAAEAMRGEGGMMSFGPSDDPIRAAFAQRRTLDERYMKLLYELLDEEQVASLPKLPSEQKRGPIMIRRSSGGPEF